MIIALNGYSGSGKDTIAAIIQYLTADEVGHTSVKDIVEYYKNYQWFLETQSDWRIKKFAYKLKLIASILTGVPVDMFEDQQFKKKYLPEIWSKHGLPITAREFLQKLGTDCIREELHNNTWVNALLCDYVPQDEKGEIYPNWVITDCRFVNEARAIKKLDGIIIRVDRPNVSPVNRHVSETTLDTWDFDYKILNASDLESLAFTVETILKKIGIPVKRSIEYSQTVEN